jgi:surface carbohydrate biosynthesis protein
MKKKIIYFSIEIKVREYLGSLILAVYALYRNFSVIIGSKNKILNLIKKKNKGGIFFYKAGIHKNFLQDIKKKTDVHAVIDQEILPGLNKDLYKKIIPQSFHKEVLDHIDYYFACNKDIFKAAKISLPNVSVKNTGLPKFDILKPKYKEIFELQKRKIQKKHGKFILFNSDLFYVSKYHKQQATEYVSWGIKNEKSKKIFLKNSATESIKRYKEFNIITNFFRSIDNKINIKIIIRPHPAESIVDWKNELKNCKNIIIEPATFDVHPWILASEGVLHRGCSTAFQSLFCKKPTGYLALGDQKTIKENHLKDYHFKKILYESSFKINNIEDLNYFIKNRPLLNKYFRKKISYHLGQSEVDASKKIVEILSQKNVIREEFSKKIYLNYFLKGKIKIKLIKIIYKLNNIKHLLFKNLIIFFTKINLINKNINKYYMTPKIPYGISKLETEMYLKIFNKIINKKKMSRIYCSQLDQDLVLIEKK